MTIKTFQILRFSFLISLTFGTAFSYAQKLQKHYEKAVSVLYQHQYNDAFHLFDKIYEEDPEFEDVSYRREIAALLSTNGDNHPLDQLLKYETEYSEKDDHFYYWVGQALLRRYHIDAAIRAFERFRQRIEYLGTDEMEEVAYMIEHITDLKYHFNNPGNYEIHQLDEKINSLGSELSPVFIDTDQTLVFFSNRENLNNSYKLYQTKKGIEGWSNIEEINASVTITSPNTSLSFNKEENSLYLNDLSRSNALFYIEKSNNTWTKVQTLPIKPAIPELSEDIYLTVNKDKIYLSNDALGEYNIYEAFKNGKNKWSEAFVSDLSSGKSNEKFPFITSDEKTIYFSSDRLGGIGGYDIYKSILDENLKWSEPENLGWPINSPNDEIHFKMNSNNKSGYFSSNRLRSKGEFDIYVFWEIEKVKIEGRVYNKALGKIPVDAEIKFHPVQYEDEYFVGYIDKYGKYSTEIIAGEAFKVEITDGEKIIFEDYFQIEKSGDPNITHIRDFIIE